MTTPHTGLVPPDDPQVRLACERLAVWVAKRGPAFETRARQQLAGQRDAPLGFLLDPQCAAAVYYRALLRAQSSAPCDPVSAVRAASGSSQTQTNGRSAAVLHRVDVKHPPPPPPGYPHTGSVSGQAAPPTPASVLPSAALQRHNARPAEHRPLHSNPYGVPTGVPPNVPYGSLAPAGMTAYPPYSHTAPQVTHAGPQRSHPAPVSLQAQLAAAVAAAKAKAAAEQHTRNGAPPASNKGSTGSAPPPPPTAAGTPLPAGHVASRHSQPGSTRRFFESKTVSKDVWRLEDPAPQPSAARLHTQRRHPKRPRPPPDAAARRVDGYQRLLREQCPDYYRRAKARRRTGAASVSGELEDAGVMDAPGGGGRIEPTRAAGSWGAESGPTASAPRDAGGERPAASPTPTPPDDMPLRGNVCLNLLTMIGWDGGSLGREGRKGITEPLLMVGGKQGHSKRGLGTGHFRGVIESRRSRKARRQAARQQTAPPTSGPEQHE